MAKKKRVRPLSESEDDFDEGEDEMMGFSDELGEGGIEEEEEADQGAGPGPGSSGVPGTVKLKKKGSQKPEREPIYDVEGMHEKLEDFGWGDVAWEETQAITHDDPKQVEDADDDIARELAFYTQALSAAQQAIVRFQGSSTPWLRPADYYAEMVKTDQHMAKVKEQLMYEQRSIEQAEERRKQREAKQYSKQVQADKQKERNASKKRAISDVSKLRKQRVKSGFAGELDYDAEMAAMERGTDSRGSGRGGRGERGGQRGRGGTVRDRGAPPGRQQPLNKKRQARDAKFGHGGAKRLSKQNDAMSAADMDGYRPSRPSRGGGQGG
ncbi:eukaryotic rRNA processing protein EBP2-domain-containing protein, partial [Haematococcus lacustris]